MSKQLTSGALAVAALLIGMAGFWFIARGEPLKFGANEIPETQGIGHLLYGYVVTLVGVFLGTAYRELQDRRRKGQKHIANLRSFARSLFRSIDLWMGLCGAPLVFALLWRSLEGGQVAALTAIALQNGFSCTVVIAGLSGADSTAKEDTEPADGGSS